MACLQSKSSKKNQHNLRIDLSPKERDQALIDGNRVYRFYRDVLRWLSKIVPVMGHIR